jgi:uncharacterized membrane protein YfcA
MSAGVAILLALSGVAVGAFSALFGVGGGLLMAPLITVFLDRSQHLAEGTSLLAIIPISIAGVLAHRGRGYVSLRAAGWLGTAAWERRLPEPCWPSPCPAIRCGSCSRSS